MRKLVLMLLSLTPVLAFAQVQNALGDAPWGSAITSLTDAMGWMIPVMVLLAVVVIGMKSVFGSGGGFNPVPLLVAPILMIGGVSMIATMSGREIDLGVWSKVSGFLGWLLAYGWIILGLLGCGSFLAYMVFRWHEKASLEKQLKADVRDLLQIIQLADLVEAYWKPRHEQITAKTRVGKAEKARSELLPMLEQAYAGQALTSRQRAKMLEQGAEIAKVAVDEVGAPLDPAAEHLAPPSGPRAEAVTPARPSASPNRQARQQPAQPAPTSSPHSCSSSGWILPAIAAAVVVDALCSDDPPARNNGSGERAEDCNADTGAGDGGGWGDSGGSDGGSTDTGSIGD